MPRSHKSGRLELWQRSSMIQGIEERFCIICGVDRDGCFTGDYPGVLGDFGPNGRDG